MMGFIIKKVVVSFKLFVIETWAKRQVFRNNSPPIRKKHKIKQQEIINLQYFVFQQF